MTKDKLQQILKEACQHCDRPVDCISKCEILAEELLKEIRVDMTQIDTVMGYDLATLEKIINFAKEQGFIEYRN